jgi:hypothetical protein
MLEISEFSPQVWEPFEAWVRTTYPEDVASMYAPAQTEVSNALWKQRTREYVEEVGRAGGVEPAPESAVSAEFGPAG